MSFRPTHLGGLLAQDREPEFIELLTKALERTRGNLKRAAFQLGISRRHLYRYLNYANLWSEVDRTRAKPRQDPLSKALREL